MRRRGSSRSSALQRLGQPRPLSPRRPRASSRDGGGVVNRPPSSLTMLLSRHTRRREFLLVGCGVLASSGAQAQTPTPIGKIGYLHPRTIALDSPTLRVLKAAWESLGYAVPGSVILRSAADNPTRLPKLAGELVDFEGDRAQISRVTMILNPDNPAAAMFGSALEAAARPLGIEPTIAHVHGVADIESAAAAAAGSSNSGLFVAPDVTLYELQRAMPHGPCVLCGLPAESERSRSRREAEVLRPADADRCRARCGSGQSRQLPFHGGQDCRRPQAARVVAAGQRGRQLPEALRGRRPARPDRGGLGQSPFGLRPDERRSDVADGRNAGLADARRTWATSRLAEASRAARRGPQSDSCLNGIPFRRGVLAPLDNRNPPGYRRDGPPSPTIHDRTC